MLHDIDFKNDMTPKFFRALMNDGIIDVPAFNSQEVKG
jgi:CRISPR-associated protein Cas5d